MKRAFTLIELLVVIAIIAILAAILFPVFAQAKVAAKRTAAISGQKQIGTAIQIYMGGYDDMFPRNDDCAPNSSLNPNLNSRAFNATGVGCTAAPFHYRMNHYSWQKWVMPYAKNVQIFEHPARKKLNVQTGSCPAGQWSDCGQIMGGFALNLALTGALDTYNKTATNYKSRNSWLGGTQNTLPDVSAAMLTFEIGNPTINFAPVVIDSANNPLNEQTVYPMAIREFWAANFMQPGTGTCVYTNDPDPRATVGGSITVGFADGSAKALSASSFLSRTPTAAQYGVTLTADGQCGISSGVYVVGARPNLTIDFPFWGLGQR